ncbi:retrovirus-related pol polyprotein from transposon TNT 1-94 [Tanacetum coccineum]
MDVKSAFLYRNIEEEVYVCQPPGFEDPDFPDRVYKVEKALYGLHQDPRAWYETLSTYLLDNGFQRGKIDKTLFIKRHKGDILLMSSMGELTFFLGLQVEQKKDGIFICQDKYVAKILNKFGFTEVKTASTPMETQMPLIKDEDDEKVDVHMYRSMIGSLMYLTSSRPDIMFAECACARYQVNLKVLHLHVVKRIFSDYARASLDWKSTIGGKAKKSVKLMMEKLFRMDLELMLLHALVDGKKIIVTETSIRRDLQLADEEGVDCLPNSTIFQQLTLMRKPKRKDTQVSQPSDPIENVADEAVHKELGDSLVRAATIASSLEAECQETMGDTIAQTRFESVSKHSNDSLLVKGNTLRSNEDRLKLDELMALCTTLQNRVLDLEKITTQNNEIAKSSNNKESLGEDASKQGRIDVIDVDEEMFDVNVLDGKEVFVVEQEVAVKDVNNELNVVEEVVEFINSAKLITDAAQVSAAGNVVSTAGDATTVSTATTTTATITTGKIDADHQLAKRLQAQEQEELSIEEKPTLFQQLLDKRRKHFAVKRAEEKRND